MAFRIAKCIIAAAGLALASGTACMAVPIDGPVTCRELVDSYVQAQQEEAREIREEMTEGEKELLAQLVTAEAEGESLFGKRLVVDVVLNRVDSPDFPDSITAVIRQPGQFTSLENGRFERAAWAMAESDFQAVARELEGKRRLDSEVLFFTAGGYGKYGTPAFRHGHHYFSRKGGQE